MRKQGLLLDTDFDALYLAEERQGGLFTFFAVLTIFIACLGPFGLASFAVERRHGGEGGECQPGVGLAV